MEAPQGKMEEEGLPKVRTWAWGGAKWRRAAAMGTHGVPAESPLDGSHGASEAHFGILRSLRRVLGYIGGGF